MLAGKLGNFARGLKGKNLNGWRGVILELGCLGACAWLMV